MMHKIIINFEYILIHHITNFIEQIKKESKNKLSNSVQNICIVMVLFIKMQLYQIHFTQVNQTEILKLILKKAVVKKGNFELKHISILN